MKPVSQFLIGAALITAAGLAAAHDYTVGPIKIGHPFARATTSGQKSGGAYLSLDNTGTTGDKLLSADAGAKIAASTEIHEMSMQGDVMKMKQIEALDLPAGKTVALKPGGFHIMLMGLKAPLKEGEKFPLKLRFEKAGEVEVSVHVEAPGSSGGHDGHKH